MNNQEFNQALLELSKETKISYMEVGILISRLSLDGLSNEGILEKIKEKYIK